MCKTVFQRRNGITRCPGLEKHHEMRRRIVRQLKVDENVRMFTPKVANRAYVSMDLVGEGCALAVDVVAHRHISSVAEVNS